MSGPLLFNKEKRCLIRLTLQDWISLHFWPHCTTPKGRVMKVSLDSDDVRSDLYDRDNGNGAFQNVVTELHTNGTNSDYIQSQHAIGVHQAANDAYEEMGNEVTLERDGDISTVYLGLGDVRDVLKPAVDRYIG